MTLRTMNICWPLPGKSWKDCFPTIHCSESASAWVTVDSGTYFYGDKKERYEIVAPFQVTEYPVTNAQFAGFVEETYSVSAFWHPAGWKWRTANNVSQPEYWQDSKSNGPTQPVMGVTWWEADAYGL